LQNPWLPPCVERLQLSAGARNEVLRAPERITPERMASRLLAFIVDHHHLKATSKGLPKPRPGWALIRVRLAGICNTDLEILRGYHNFRGTPGHEFVGEVHDLAGVPAGTRKRWMGRRVAGEINIACRALGFRPVCRFCKRGLKRHCARRRVLGIVGQAGAFAEYLVLPLENLHRVPRGISDQAAVFVEPLAAACEILDQVPVRLFKSAAVLGDGKLAQLIARVLRSELERVVLFGKHARKLSLARSAKVETRRVAGDGRGAEARDDSFGLVVEATGSPTGLALALRLTEPRGTLVLKSTFHGASPVETWPVVVKELQVVGSRCGPFEKAMALLRSGQVDPRPLIDRTFPLRQAPAAIRFAGQPGVLKVLLQG
jgi:threonine dehydrogenase-like Zn-dependent dehydrogenase